MTATWPDRLARVAVGLYPRRWRDRYADEVLDVLDQHRAGTRTVVNLALNAAAARLDPAYRGARMSARLRGNLTVAAVLITILAASLGLYALTFREATDFGVIGAHDLAYSADEQLIATTSGAATVRLWDAADPVHPVRRSSFTAGFFLALSPDGHTLAVIGDAIELWNVTDPAHPERATTLTAYHTGAQAVEFSPDGRTLAVGAHDTVLLYDVTDPARPVQLTPLPANPQQVPEQTFMTETFSPDGRMLATTSGDSTVVSLWNVTEPARPRIVATLGGGGTEAVAFAPDGDRLATARADGTTTLWNLADPARPAADSTVDADVTRGRVTGTADNPIQLAFGRDGHTLITVMGNDVAAWWDITEPTRIVHRRDLTRGGAGPGQFRIAPDGRTVVSAAHEPREMINLWILDQPSMGIGS
jgi:WD40 repeat protein